jgi:hypothetical protein
MTFANKSSPIIQYSKKTINRAERAVRCAHFTMRLFEMMRWQSVELKQIAGHTGHTNGYIKQPLPELSVEADLVWLIQTGLLRREVDGQGITDSFRLTPLGHQLVERWQHHGRSWPQPSWLDRIYNALNRWVRLPSWLR